MAFVVRGVAPWLTLVACGSAGTEAALALLALVGTGVGGCAPGPSVPSGTGGTAPGAGGINGSGGATGASGGGNPDENAVACASPQGTPWRQSLGVPTSAYLARDHQGDLILTTDGAAPAVVKVDARGQQRWRTPLGRAGPVSIGSNGDILVANWVPGTEATDPSVRKGGSPRSQTLISRLDEEGNVRSQTRVGDDTGDMQVRFVSESPEGNVVVAGTLALDTPPTIVNPQYREGFFVASVSSSGQLLWARNHSSAMVRGVAFDATGRLTMILGFAGQTLDIDGVKLQTSRYPSAEFLVWFDADGRAQEAVDISEYDLQRFSDLVIDDRGRLYVCGSIGHNPQIGESYTSELFVAGLQPSGERLWTQRFSLTDQDEYGRLALDPCGDVLFAGNGRPSSATFLAARLSRDGSVKKRLVVPGDFVRAIAYAPGGIFAATGTAYIQEAGSLARIDL